LAIGGLATLTRQPNLKHTIGAPQDLDHEIYETLTVDGSTIYEIDGGITLTYNITEYDGTNSIPSGRTVSTWASCSMFHLDDSGYWEEYDFDDQTFNGMLSKSHSWTQMEGFMKLTLILETHWKNQSNGETIAEVLRALYDKSPWYAGSELVAWAAPLANKSNEFSVTCKKSIINDLAIF